MRSNISALLFTLAGSVAAWTPVPHSEQTKSPAPLSEVPNFRELRRQGWSQFYRAHAGRAGAIEQSIQSIEQPARLNPDADLGYELGMANITMVAELSISPRGTGPSRLELTERAIAALESAVAHAGEQRSMVLNSGSVGLRLLSAQPTPEGIQLSVHDNGQGWTPSELEEARANTSPQALSRPNAKNHFGQRNVAERLYGAFGRKAKMSLQSGSEGGSQVDLQLP